MKQKTKKANLPFFAQFLSNQIADTTKVTGSETMKFPSDHDETRGTTITPP